MKKLQNSFNCTMLLLISILQVQNVQLTYAKELSIALANVSVHTKSKVQQIKKSSSINEKNKVNSANALNSSQIPKVKISKDTTFDNTNKSVDVKPDSSESQSLNEPLGSSAHSFYSASLEQAVNEYKQSASEQKYANVLNEFKNILVGSYGLRINVATIVKDNPYLIDFKPRLVEGNSCRLWSFPKASERDHFLFQFYDVHHEVIGTGRRKRVVSTGTIRFQQLRTSQKMTVRDIGIISGKENQKCLMLSGDSENGSLVVNCFTYKNLLWELSPDYLSQVPEFLTKNTCGRVSIKGTDLLFNVARMVELIDSNGIQKYFPEAESNCYKFWLKLADNRYVINSQLIDDDAFRTVAQFLQAIEQVKTDSAKSLLQDSRLVSLPKYLGLQGKSLDPQVRVVQMNVPASRGHRFRLINCGKDDLIFDVGKVKGQNLIKAIFIASPDPFVQETVKYFPLFSGIIDSYKVIDLKKEEITSGSEKIH